jgi:glycine/D-amino acid oxidase-like deaminating enzyme
VDGDGPDQAKDLSAEASLADERGFDAVYLDSTPYLMRPGVRFADQARVHPRSYLAGVAKAFVAFGGRIHEHSEAGEFCDDPRRVLVNRHTVTSEDFVIATNNPLVGLGGKVGATLFQTKLASTPAT